MIRTNNVVIFSVDKGIARDESARKYCIDTLKSHDVEFNIGHGVYKGVMEQCYVVVNPDATQTMVINSLASEYKQESILLVDGSRHATLEFFDGTLKGLGRLTEVTRQEAIKEDNYTALNGRYFVTRS